MLNRIRGFPISGRMVRWLWLTVALGEASVADGSANPAVKFRELSSARLPYGKPLAIEGTVADLGTRIKDLQKWVKVAEVEVKYKAGGTEKTASSLVGDAGGSWRVTVGPFEEGSTVELQFVAKGALASSEALDKLLHDQRLIRAWGEFLDAAAGQKEDVALRAVERFAEKTVELLKGALPPGFSLEPNSAAMAATLFSRPEFVNLSNRLEDVRREVPAWRSLTAPEVYERIQECARLQSTLQPDEKDAPLPGCPARIWLTDYQDNKGFLWEFSKDYENVKKEFKDLNLSAATKISVSTFELATVKYLEKYAGADVASLWIPRLDEMRAFAVLHLYWGPVELTPEQPAGGKAEWLRQRFSLGFGYSLKNVSSSHDTKIRGNNVWFYGIGFRFNRYFRINAGGALYRGPAAEAGLRNDFLVGPSLDVTALQYFRNIFAKTNSAK